MINDNLNKVNSDGFLFRSLFFNSSYAKIIVDSLGKICVINMSFEALFGYDMDEVVGQDITVLMPEKYRVKHGEHLRSYIKFPKNKTMGFGRKIEAQKKDGSFFDVEITLNYIEADNGFFVGVTCSELLVSGLKKKLTDTEERFSLVTKAANVGMWSAVRGETSKEKSLLESFVWTINDQLVLQMGHKPGVGFTYDDYLKTIHPEDSSVVIKAFLATIKHKQKYNVTYRVITPVGETRYIESKGEASFNDKNEIERIDGITLDVTTRLEMEKRRAIYHEISQKLNTNISVFDFCEFIKGLLKQFFLIDSLYVMLYNEDESHLTSIFISDSMSTGHSAINRKNGNGVCEYVIKNKESLLLTRADFVKFLIDHKTQQYRAVPDCWMGVPLNSEERTIGLLSIENLSDATYSSEDLTLVEFIGVQLGRLISRKRNHYQLKVLNTTLEERVELRTYELEKAKDKITESLKKEKELSGLKSRFVSTASHQFRTPLTVIQTNLGILDLQKKIIIGDNTEKFDKISNRIKGQISKMTDMMDDLLTIGKINENGINFRPIPIDIVRLSKKVAKGYDDIQNDGRILSIVERGVRRKVMLDPTLMEHVLSALISNAFKYSKNAGNPIITLSFLKNEFHLTIKDFGIGIPYDEIGHIHEPFFRASNAIDIPGTGLGTSIVKEYVEINKGQLYLTSEKNKFTEFKLVFKD